MLNAHQLRQLAEQTLEAARVAVARVGIFDEKGEAQLHQLAVSNATAAVHLHDAVASVLAEKQANGE